jgi:hypothetical protein
MITFQVRDFRGCTKADVEVNPIAIVGGRNGAGKTSIAQGAGAVLTGSALPLAGLARGSAGVLVRTGASGASVTVRGESGTARIDWPAAQPVSEGEPPTASPYAAGLVSVATMPGAERVRVLSEYLKSDPTREDLRAALERTPSLAEHTEAIWQLITAKGWDGAHAIRREKGAEYKGAWRQVTGINYGSRVAAGWRPDLAEEPLAEPELVALVEQADRDRNRALAAAAVSNVERDRLAVEASNLDAASGNDLRTEAEVSRIQGEITAARERRAALPTGEQPSTMPCPHCGGALVLRRVSLVETRLEAAGAKIAGEELRAQRRAIAEADGTIEHLAGDLVAAQRRQAEARAAVAAATNARQRLADMPQVPQGEAPDLEAAKTALTRAERRLALWRQKSEADDLYSRIAGNELVLELLAPDGLRAARLAQVLEVFNKAVLGELAASAGWNPVTVAPDLSVSYAGRPYGLCATSEQYRARAVLQLAMARLDGSQMVVLDAADVLDGPTRSGLFSMLEAAGLPALVCMTLSRREQLPNLAGMGLGASYWIEAGTAERLPAPSREVAA